LISAEFNNLKLHDGSLDRVEILWASKLCRFYLHAFTEKDKDALPHVLEFQNVTGINAPHLEPWGPSVFINSAKFESESFQIEMQSGDIISINAEGFSFAPSNHSLKRDK